jgi:PBP1b-binding outer membrane lipoprotein LpoB
MKKTIIALSLIVLIAGCTKVELPQPAPIDLGVNSTSTAIKSINQTNNIVTAVFETTVGSKYSVQIVPFGSEEPIKKEGFTANELTTQKTYDLSGLPKKDYDLIFIDINGKEVKYPIVIK